MRWHHAIVLLLALSLFGASFIQGRTFALLTDATSVGSNTIATSAAVVRVAEGSFTKSTAGAPASQTIPGVGFQPKAVIFFWTRQTAEGFAAMQSTGFGFTTGSSNERGVAIAEDDGKGFDVGAVNLQSGETRGLGLLGMEERITLLGGRFYIESQPDHGTSLTLEVPLH